MTQPNNKKTNQQIVAEYTCMVTELSPSDVRQALLFLAEKLDAAEALIATQQKNIENQSSLIYALLEHTKLHLMDGYVCTWSKSDPQGIPFGQARRQMRVKK